MPNVLGLDPGTWETAYVGWDQETNKIIEHGFVPNEELLSWFREGQQQYTHVGIEMIASYGMPVGKTTFETCLVIGRIIEIITEHIKSDRHGRTMSQQWRPSWRLCYRKQVTKHVCSGRGAGDTNVRRAVMDLFPAIGGGKEPVVGIKSQPGPLFGISKHKWPALAVAIYAGETTGTWNAIPETTKG
jgi:hypothetical protein